MTTTIEIAGAGGHAAAVTKDTGRAARLTIAAADVRRVLESELIIQKRVGRSQVFFVRRKITFSFFLRSRGRVYGRGRSRSREDDRYNFSSRLRPHLHRCSLSVVLLPKIHLCNVLLQPEGGSNVDFLCQQPLNDK